MKQKSKIIYRITLTFFIIVFLVLGTLFLFPYFERVSDKPAENSADWMRSIGDEVFLGDIVIPGTHDSATTYVQLPYFMRCQSLTVKQQLEAGYRYLDIRLNEENGTMFFYHSFAKCKTGIMPWANALELTDVLEPVYEFLKNHPTETVIFVVKQEGSGDMVQFQNALQNYILRNPEKWLLTDKVPALGEARGKIVLFRRYSDAAGLGDKAGIALGWSDQGGRGLKENHMNKETVSGVDFYVQDRYNYTMEDKKTGMEEGLLGAKKLAGTNSLRISFLSTAGPNSLHHPYKIAKQMNAWFLKQQFDGNIGWVIFDHGDAALAESVYQLNFTDK